MGPMAGRTQIVVRGIVQGVGFRPFVYTLAESLHLKGYVTNTSEGVFIDIEGTLVSEFVQRLKEEAPPLSQITDISVTSLPIHGYSDFTIHRSVDQADHHPFTLISPDVSVCDDCLHEMLDATDRRYLYPFINCTNCGPRYSITKSVPYDRPNTTMASFAMCPACLKEYHDPRNRRFHAQPNACAACGPQVEFKIQNEKFKIKNKDNAIASAINMLKQGGIVAVKGIGGFHLACDATNDNAVNLLRERKRKSNKPFAVMAPSVESAGQFGVISNAEKELLQSVRRPIVLLRKRDDGSLSAAVAPNNQFIGIMLPYAPLHYLLFRHPPGPSKNEDIPHFQALVMTSGNLSEEPIVHENEEAVKKLSGIVDGFLLHDRDIFMRVDDSVVRVQSTEFNAHGIQQEVANNTELKTGNSKLSFLRRSRGYAPDPIALYDEGPEVLGCGADLKTTFTLTKGKFAIPSQHIGDMENYETLKFYEESLANLKAVYRADPAVFVHDLHPGYGTTRWAIEKGSGQNIKTYAIQHHYAHIGAVMAEHGLTNKVIGVALDGTGYGTDGHLWGGEFLLAGIEGFERAGQFQYVPLPGGESAIREPWRTAVSYVLQADPEGALDHLQKIGFIQKYGQETIKNLLIVIRSQELSPLACGAGRLFDAVSALLGICDTNTFEGEAAIALESFTQPGIDEEYEVAFKEKNSYSSIDFGPTLLAIIDDICRGVAREIIATKFHNTVAAVVKTVVGQLRINRHVNDVALSGGTFQNLYLLDRITQQLSNDGMNVFTNHKVPCNDACISLGQAYLIRERIKKSETKEQ